MRLACKRPTKAPRHTWHPTSSLGAMQWRISFPSGSQAEMVSSGMKEADNQTATSFGSLWILEAMQAPSVNDYRSDTAP
jgi:hypothetical protein